MGKSAGKVTEDGVTLACALKVGMRDLRSALAATVPHSEPTKTGAEPGPLSRVRLIAAKGELHVIAMSDETSAWAVVTIDEDSRDELFAVPDAPLIVDLDPGSVRKVLQVFKVGRPTADAAESWAEIRLDASGEDGRGEVQVTDVSALLPGARFSIPTLGLAPDFPDVVKVLADALRHAAGDVKPLVTRSKPLQLFVPAAVAYGEPLQVEPTGSGESRGFIVQVGDKFLGSISSRHNDDDSLKRRGSQRRKWLERTGLQAPLASVG